MPSTLAAFDRLGIAAHRGLSKAQMENMRKARAAQPLWQAREAFSYRDPVVGVVTIAAGECVHDSGHLAVARHPDKFTKTTRGAVVRKSPAAPAPASLKAKQDKPPRRYSGAWRREIPAWRLGHEVELRQRMPATPITVSFTTHARERLETVLQTAGNSETGGPLFGPRHYSYQPTMRIHAAYGPGPLARRRRESLDVDDFRDDQVEREHKAMCPDEIRHGYFHSHPEAGDDTPSDGDLAVFEAMARAAVVDRFVMVIATPDESRGWRRPVLTPWIIRLNATIFGRTVCERGRLR